MSAIYIAAAADYVERIASDTSAVDLKPLVTDAVGTSVRRVGRFIQLALIGAGRCAKAARPVANTAVYLGSGRGDLEVTLDVMQTLLRDGHAPKPLSFINTVSNAACYYVAQSLKLMSRSSFVCNRYFAFESVLQLAALDMQSAAIDSALVGTVDVVVPPLAGHRVRLGLGNETAVADATHWLFLQRSAEKALGQLVAAEHCDDAQALRDWLAASQPTGDAVLATGQFMQDAEAQQWARDLALPMFDYRAQRAYYDSQSGALIHAFLRSDAAHSALVHLNRDPSGRYSAVVVRR